jgi:hypothetical protein
MGLHTLQTLLTNLFTLSSVVFTHYSAGVIQVSVNYTLPISLYYSTHKVLKTHNKSSLSDISVITHYHIKSYHTFGFSFRVHDSLLVTTSHTLSSVALDHRLTPHAAPPAFYTVACCLSQQRCHVLRHSGKRWHRGVGSWLACYCSNGSARLLCHRWPERGCLPSDALSTSQYIYLKHTTGCNQWRYIYIKPSTQHISNYLITTFVSVEFINPSSRYVGYVPTLRKLFYWRYVGYVPARRSVF